MANGKNFIPIFFLIIGIVTVLVFEEGCSTKEVVQDYSTCPTYGTGPGQIDPSGVTAPKSKENSCEPLTVSDVYTGGAWFWNTDEGRACYTCIDEVWAQQTLPLYGVQDNSKCFTSLVCKVVREYNPVLHYENIMSHDFTGLRNLAFLFEPDNLFAVFTACAHRPNSDTNCTFRAGCASQLAIETCGASTIVAQKAHQDFFNTDGPYKACEGLQAPKTASDPNFIYFLKSAEDETCQACLGVNALYNAERIWRDNWQSARYPCTKNCPIPKIEALHKNISNFDPRDVDKFFSCLNSNWKQCFRQVEYWIDATAQDCRLKNPGSAVANRAGIAMIFGNVTGAIADDFLKP